MCFNGSMKHRNLPYISGQFDEGKCPSVGGVGNIFSFCEAALKISGPVPIVQEIGLDLGADTLGSAVTGANVGDNTVAIVGTSQGTIIKILLAGGRASVVDSFKAADNEPILSGTRMHRNNVDLIVLTPRRVKRIQIADCTQLGFCAECLSKRDPFCGWCSLQNECTLQADCSDLSSRLRSSPSKWLSLGAKHQCIHLENITPSSLAIAEMTNISLQISALPELPPTDQYQCVYDGHLSLRATKVPGGLVCPSPPLASRPNIPANTDHVTMNLAVTSHRATKEFVSTNIMLFNCATHSTCLDCVSSLWPCAWCVYSNKCAHISSGEKNCREAIVSTDTSVFQLLQDNPSQLISYGHQYCPRVELANEIFVPNNVPQELSLRVTNLPDLAQHRGETKFMCQVEIEEIICQMDFTEIFMIFIAIFPGKLAIFKDEWEGPSDNTSFRLPSSECQLDWRPAQWSVTRQPSATSPAWPSTTPPSPSSGSGTTSSTGPTSRCTSAGWWEAIKATRTARCA